MKILFGCSHQFTLSWSVSWWVLSHCVIVKDYGLLAACNYNFHQKQILLRMWKNINLCSVDTPIRKGRTRLYLHWQLSEKRDHFKEIQRLNFTLFGSCTVGFLGFFWYKLCSKFPYIILKMLITVQRPTLCNVKYKETSENNLKDIFSWLLKTGIPERKGCNF